jgi:hypothetical protein
MFKFQGSRICATHTNRVFFNNCLKKKDFKKLSSEKR